MIVDQTPHLRRSIWHSLTFVLLMEAMGHCNSNGKLDPSVSSTLEGVVPEDGTEIVKDVLSPRWEETK